MMPAHIAEPPICMCGRFLDWLPIPTVEQGGFFCRDCDENHPEYFGPEDD